MEGTERNKDITGKENRKKTTEGHFCHHIDHIANKKHTRKRSNCEKQEKN